MSHSFFSRIFSPSSADADAGVEIGDDANLIQHQEHCTSKKQDHDNKVNSSSSLSTEHDDAKMLMEEMVAASGFDDAELASVWQAEQDVLGGSYSSTINNNHTTTQSTTVHQEKRNTMASSSSTDPAQLSLLHDAIALLPPERRHAYEAAVQTARRVVELETPARVFVRCCHDNYWQAAERLCDFWQRRREIFGPEDYARPLRMEGLSKESSRDNNNNNDNPQRSEQEWMASTALSVEARDILSRGVLCILPQPDQFGRPVLLYDRENIVPSRENNAKLKQARLQVVFYLLQALSEHPNAAALGFVSVVNTEQRVKTKAPPDSEIGQLIKSQIVPVAIRGAHILNHQRQTTSSSNSTTAGLQYQLVEKSLNLYFSIVQNCSFMKMRLRFHTVYHDDDDSDLEDNDENNDNDRQQDQRNRNMALFQDLKQYGLFAHHVPERCGGTAKNGFEAWRAQRLCMEQERYDGAFRTSRSGDADKKAAKLKTTPDDPTCKKRKLEQFSDWAENHLVSYKMAQLNEEISPLEGERERLGREQDFLKAQLVCVQAFARQYEADYQQVSSTLETLERSVFPNARSVLGMPQAQQQQPCLGGGRNHESFAQAVLRRHLLFLGRAYNTGQWMFSIVANQTPEQVMLLQGLQVCLTHTQQTTPVPMPTMQNLTAEDSSTQHPQAPTGDDDLQYQSLATQVQQLQNQKQFLEQRRKLLQAAVDCTLHIERELDSFKQQHSTFLADFYSFFFTTLTGVASKEYLVAPFCPKLLANRILDLYTQWDARSCSVHNAIVSLAQSSQGILDARTASSVSKQDASKEVIPSSSASTSASTTSAESDNPEREQDQREKQRVFTKNPVAVELLMQLFSGMLAPDALMQLLQVLHTLHDQQLKPTSVVPTSISSQPEQQGSQPTGNFESTAQRQQRDETPKPTLMTGPEQNTQEELRLKEARRKHRLKRKKLLKRL